jgi:hypothetical protein
VRVPVFGGRVGGLKRPEIRRRKSALKGRGFGDAWGNHRLDFNRAIPELISIIIAVVATAAVAASSSALVAAGDGDRLKKRERPSHLSCHMRQQRQHLNTPAGLVIASLPL